MRYIDILRYFLQLYYINCDVDAEIQYFEEVYKIQIEVKEKKKFMELVFFDEEVKLMIICFK